jgi:hypothetical protein
MGSTCTYCYKLMLTWKKGGTSYIYSNFALSTTTMLVCWLHLGFHKTIQILPQTLTIKTIQFLPQTLTTTKISGWMLMTILIIKMMFSLNHRSRLKRRKNPNPHSSNRRLFPNHRWYHKSGSLMMVRRSQRSPKST